VENDQNIKKGNTKILLHDNAPSHIAKLVKKTIEAFNWEILGVQVCFRRFPIDGFSGKWWSK